MGYTGVSQFHTSDVTALKIINFGSSLSEQYLFTFGLFLHFKIILNSLTYSGPTRLFGNHYLSTLQPSKIFAVLQVFFSCYDKLWGLPRRVFTLLHMQINKVFIYVGNKIKG